MKKLSFVLAMIIACGALAACKGNSDGTTAPKSSSSNPPKQSESAKTTQKPGSTTKPGTTKPAETTKQPEGEDTPKDELIDGTKFKVDGDLTEWTEQNLHGMTLKGEGDTANKSATFYGAMTTTGLYMACDVYHDIYISGQTSAFRANTYCIVTVNDPANRFTIYATGMDQKGAYFASETTSIQLSEVIMKTDEIGDATKYHTVMECFIANDSLPEFSVFQNTINVGIALGMHDNITGSVYAGEDGYSGDWGIPGYMANQVKMVATPKGLYGFEEYFAEAE